MKKIFDNILINKRLKIIQYNKKTQKKLCLSINDYSQLYLPIEIEIKPAISKYCKRKFINIKKDNEKYYHIYFDGKSKEINRYYLSAEEKVNKIKILIDHQVKSFKELFYECFRIESINFEKFYRIDITDMSSMFYGCYRLEKLNLSNFNTNNVTDMSCMFYGCSSIKELNISNFNTNNIKDMRGMFSGCSIDLNKKIYSENKNIKDEAFEFY